MELITTIFLKVHYITTAQMYYLALNNHQELGKFHYLEIPNIEEAYIQKLRK